MPPASAPKASPIPPSTTAAKIGSSSVEAELGLQAGDGAAQHARRGPRALPANIQV